MLVCRLSEGSRAPPLQRRASAQVAVDRDTYGGSTVDLRSSRQYVDASERPLPLISKDFIIDPIQIARAASDGADAVLLIAAAAAADLPALLDTCTVLGIEALVEVHTPDEVTLASELGASLLLVNQASRP